MSVCKHCKKEFNKKDIANHSRWCDLNPKRNQYNKDLSKARSAKKNFNNQYTYGAVVSKETKEKQERRTYDMTWLETISDEKRRGDADMLCA